MEEEQKVTVKTLTPEAPSLRGNKLSLKKGGAVALLAGGFFVILALGTGTGYLVHRLLGKPTSNKALPKGTVSEEKIKKGAEFGMKDSSVFKDKAIGVLREGGIDGEGTHHLEREGGVSQNVYLTSSVVDLSQFVGRRVEVWGETFSGQKAGWLMDVGKLKVLD